MHEPAAEVGRPEPARRPGAARDFFAGLRAAVMLLTRLPVGQSASSPGALRAASGWFVLVGAALGGLCAATHLSLLPILGPRVAAILAVVVGLFATGALHEDGLADTADALGGARDRVQIFTILKDSRHGTYGVLALVVAVTLRWATLAELGAAVLGALVLGGAISRAALVVLLRGLPYVSPPGQARNAAVAHAGSREVVFAMVSVAGVLSGVVLLGALTGAQVLAALAAATLATSFLAWRFAVRAGGITGDFLGATQQIVELGMICTVLGLD